MTEDKLQDFSAILIYISKLSSISNKLFLSFPIVKPYKNKQNYFYLYNLYLYQNLLHLE